MNCYKLVPLLLALGVFFTPSIVKAQDAGAPDAAVAVPSVDAADLMGVIPPAEVTDEDLGAVTLKASEIVGIVPPAEVTPENVTENVTLLIRSAKNGQWSLFAGFLIMLLLFVANKAGLKDKIGDKAVPWVGLLLGILSSIGVMLASGISADEAIISGLVAGLTATGGWELIFKHLLTKKAA